MPYLVETVRHNGYRCGCCSRDWESSEWVDDRDEALAQVPREFPEETEWGGLKSICVTDGSTRDIIASGTIFWSDGYGRGSGYEYTRWTGHIDGEPFDLIRRGKELVDKSWDECVEEVKKKYAERVLREAKGEIKTRVKKLEALGVKVDWKLESQS